MYGILTGNSKCATNRAQLNADCMLAVVDQMDFPTLLTMAETSHFYSQLCAFSFRHRFSDRQIIIDNDPLFAKPTARLWIDDKSIYFDSVHMALKTLRIFGNVIRKLKLRLTNADTVKSIAIIRQVDKYCADSLIELTLDVSGSNALQHNSKPFKKVEHLSFEGRFPSMEQQTIPINQMFPALRSMYLKIWSANDSYLTYHFPHLEYLHIDISTYQQDVDTVMGLISENKQIRSIFLHDYE